MGGLEGVSVLQERVHCDFPLFFIAIFLFSFLFISSYTKFLHFSASFFCSLVRIVLIDIFFELVPRENKCVCTGLVLLLQTIVIAGTTSVCWFSPRMRFLWKTFTFPFRQSLLHNCSFYLPHTPIFSHFSVPYCVHEWAFLLFALQILQNSPNTFFPWLPPSCCEIFTWFQCKTVCLSCCSWTVLHAS